MSQTALLVDYENVHKVDLSQIPAHVQVRLFVGATQSKTTMDFAMQVHALGTRFKLIRITGHGPNALDFHIAYYLGEYIAATPRATYIILSSDKGFDPLVQHLTSRSLDVRRATTLRDAFPTKAPPSMYETHIQHVKELLQKVEKNKRPRKRASLLAYLKTHFSKKLSATEVEKLVQEMFARELLTEASDRLVYGF